MPLLPSAAQQRTARLASGRIVIACGGSADQDGERLYLVLGRGRLHKAITPLVHRATLECKTGELRGVDRWAEAWAQDRAIAIERYPIASTVWDKVAASMRDKQIVPGPERTSSGTGFATSIPSCTRNTMPCRHGARRASTHCTTRRQRPVARNGIPVWRPFG